MESIWTTEKNNSVSYEIVEKLRIAKLFLFRVIPNQESDSFLAWQLQKTAPLFYTGFFQSVCHAVYTTN
jgi:hypothetical protein